MKPMRGLEKINPMGTCPQSICLGDKRRNKKPRLEAEAGDVSYIVRRPSKENDVSYSGRRGRLLGSPHDRKLLCKMFEDVDLFESASALLMLRDASHASS